MIPIFEQGSGNGIGHNLSSFIERFVAIAREHVATGRAKAFAFIFYDFGSSDLRRVLQNQGAFAKLDRLAGSELSVFYLHSGSARAREAFNSHFLEALGVDGQAKPPCVVFFRVREETVEDVEIAQLDSADVIHGLSEVYQALESFLAGQKAAPSESRAVRWLMGGTKFLSVEVLRAALKKGLEFF